MSSPTSSIGGTWRVINYLSQDKGIIRCAPVRKSLCKVAAPQQKQCEWFTEDQYVVLLLFLDPQFNYSSSACQRLRGITVNYCQSFLTCSFGNDWSCGGLMPFTPRTAEKKYKLLLTMQDEKEKVRRSDLHLQPWRELQPLFSFPIVCIWPLLLGLLPTRQLIWIFPPVALSTIVATSA